jgi:hypothetical protein
MRKQDHELWLETMEGTPCVRKGYLGYSSDDGAMSTLGCLVAQMIDLTIATEEISQRSRDAVHGVKRIAVGDWVVPTIKEGFLHITTDIIAIEFNLSRLMITQIRDHCIESGEHAFDLVRRVKCYD